MGSVASTSSALEVCVQRAQWSEELRAAAYLRAISFYKYPEGRSEFAAQSHRRMKTDAEFESVTSKIHGRDEAYKDVDVTAFIAVVEDRRGQPSTSTSGGGGADQVLSALRGNLEPVAVLPFAPSDQGQAAGGTNAGVGGGGGAAAAPARLVVGSLDLNVGQALPSEELIGRMPKEDPRRLRAYLSNVCVAPAARRLGVARALIQRAEQHARQAGVQWLYVHVVADNAPAVALYTQAMGFEVEQAEAEGFARSLQRPRRLILAKQLL